MTIWSGNGSVSSRGQVPGTEIQKSKDVVIAGQFGREAEYWQTVRFVSSIAERSGNSL